MVGVDVDPALIDYAKADFTGSTWLVSDLALLDLPSAGIVEPFDLSTWELRPFSPASDFLVAAASKG